MSRQVIALVLAAVVLAPAAAARAQDADAARGEQLFTAKQCVRCHRPGRESASGPPLERLRRPQGAYELAGRMWNHAPAMFTVLDIEGLKWPRFDTREMADVMAYLQADPTRDPPVNRMRGQTLLVGKGCLKCHAFKGEGAKLAPDLAGGKDRFAPAPAWAATMWAHTPRMAVIALERGILYPRFAGDEMRHLLGFLHADDGAR